MGNPIEVRAWIDGDPLVKPLRNSIDDLADHVGNHIGTKLDTLLRHFGSDEPDPETDDR